MHKWSIGWGPISRCNMNCQFCYSKTRRDKIEDLHLPDWKKFIDGNAEKIEAINYGTGENSLSDEWFDLIKYIRESYPGIRQSLTTNGYISEAIRDDKKREIFLSSIDEVDVSIDFFDEEKHNAFRGQPMAYQWAKNTLFLCRENAIPTTIVFLGSKQNLNIENIDGLFKIAKEYNSILRMNIYRPTDGITENAKKFIADHEQIVEMLKYINEKYSIIALNDSYFAPLLTGKKNVDPSGVNSLRILSDGSVTPSTYLIKDSYVLGNIKDKSILESLENNSTLTTVINDTIPNECNECLLKEKCRGGVADRRYLWGGSLECRDPYCISPVVTKIEPIITEERKDFSSVHDGYLPTMFFRP